MKRTLLFTFLATILSFQAPGTALACSCLQQSLQESIDGADAIFLGAVNEISSEDYQLAVSFHVKESWKGFEEEGITRMTVHTTSDSAACGFNFIEGEEYLVYANVNDKTGNVHTGLCSATKERAYATEDLEVLESGDWTATPFNDVPATHANFDAIAYVKDEGVVQGYPDGTFRPDQPINRAEFVKIIVEAKEFPLGNFAGVSQYMDFSDVEYSGWVGPYVVAARMNFIIEGYPDGTFKAANNINFVEAAKIIAISFELPYAEGAVWYEGYVRALADKNTIPTSIAHFDQLITRGEMAEMIWRLKAEVTGKESQAYDVLSQDWKPFTNTTYSYRIQYPSAKGIVSNSYATEPEQAANLALGPVDIDVIDPRQYDNRYAEYMDLPLKEYVSAVRLLNVENDSPYVANDVGQIDEIDVAGRVAYRFWATGAFNDYRGGYLLDRQKYFVFFEHDGLKIQFSYDHADEDLAEVMMRTFESL